MYLPWLFATGGFYAVFDGTDADDWLCKCKQHVIMDDKHSIYDKDIIDDMYGCHLWISLRHFAEGRHPGDQMMSKILLTGRRMSSIGARLDKDHGRIRGPRAQVQMPFT